jgi:hypothetical protein
MFFIPNIKKLSLFFDVWDGDGMSYAIQRFIARLPPWFKTGISRVQHPDMSISMYFSSLKRYKQFVKWLRRKQRKLMRQYNAFFTTKYVDAYAAAVALINKHSEMFTSDDFAIFLGLPDDKVTPAHFQRVVELLPRLQGPRNPPELVERATAMQRVMLEQYDKMPPNEQVLPLLEDMNVILRGLNRQCPFL